MSGEQDKPDGESAVTLRLWISYTPKGGRPRTSGTYGLRLPR